MSRPILSTHVLDTAAGTPVAGLIVELYKQKETNWLSWHSGATNGDGRLQFPFTSDSMAAGTYKLRFNVEDYFGKTGKETLYPYVEVCGSIKILVFGISSLGSVDFTFLTENLRAI